ncbi:hypothetical protein QN277_003386 [Acacia crassicarpa]|uniref:BHLH domain-containing protein n=1 Tax=Acacia crassicarpa TaxID=499986 RepID=A0AAE1MCM3_9FABA|nr:hypothetical protein QN277_003386 [Acacia crassicarpa]
MGKLDAGFDTTWNAANGIILTSNNPSTSESVVNTQHHMVANSHDYSGFMVQDKPYSFDDPSKRYLRQTNIKETDRRPEGRNSRVQDHLLAERNRRGKISQHFIALSALIPGLKRTDKASLLEGAIRHVKQLQEQVKALEQQPKKKKKTAESVVFVKKSQLTSTTDTTSLNNNSSDIENLDDVSKWNSRVAKADVEARVSEKKVLIRVQCEKKEGIMVKTMKEIQKLHLSVINSSVMPFGRSILDITIIAEMEDEFNLSSQELARNIRVALLQSI